MDNLKANRILRQNHQKQIVLLFSILGGWIIFILFIYQNFIRFDENELEYLTHEVPAFYKNPQEMEFVYIKPGYFMMGNKEDYPRKVFITNGFYIQKTEVTQSQWKGVTGSNPSHFKKCGSECPVEMITKNDAKLFVHQLNMINHENSFKYRLPTEAEWEYVVASGNNIVEENVESFEEQIKEYCWYSKNSFETTHPVAGKKPNALGIFDLHGNVNEWCEDAYYLSSGKRNSINPLNRVRDKSGNDVVRGGGWRSFYFYCRSGSRTGRLPDARFNDVGLRLVIEINTSGRTG